MFPPMMDLADEHQASSMDLFTFLSREAEKTLRRNAGLSVPLSAYDGPRLAIPCPGTGRRSPPAPLAAHGSEVLALLPLQETPGWSTFLTVSQAPCSKFPASSSATAKCPRLAAAPPMPSSARCSEATPEELEKLRFFARQIKSFRTTSIDSRELLLQSSPRQDSRELLLQSSPRQDSRELLLQSSPRQDSRELLLQSSPRQDSREPGLQGAAAAEQPTPGPLGAAADAAPDPKSASTSSTRRRGRRKRGSSASVHATESFVLVLASEPRDEGFEEEAPLRPLRVRQALLQAPRVLLAHSLSMRPWLSGARLNSVPAGDDLPVARLNFVFVSGPPAIAPTARPGCLLFGLLWASDIRP
ncbi:hypothetical protein CRENBAI_009014 [Crenichthys baileyi]|uniref:Uncharacterized protein n=1 Tax=Crenichthys baileyi TaxID=28760 RepID=A0AAV9RV75_9TELE